MIPAIVKLAIVFIAVAVMIKFKLPLILSMVGGSVMMFFMFTTDLSIVPSIIKGGVLSFDTVSLVGVVSLILVFSGILKVSGRLSRITGDFESAFGGGSPFYIIFPSVIGLLPMPGGAIFSAPMIEEKGRQEGLSSDRLSAINYWFRHNWEYMWFLYPGIIISAEIFGISTLSVTLHHLPITPIAMFIGWFFLLRGRMASRTSINWSAIPRFVKVLSPIIILIGLKISFDVLFPLINIGLHKNIIMMTALIISIAFLLIRDKPDWKAVYKVVFNFKMLSTILIVFAVFLFKETIEQSGAIDLVATEIQTYGLPFMLIITILPFIVGLLTGFTIGFVTLGLTFTASLLPSFPDISPYAALVLSYASGVAGIYLSPVHICLVLTKDYFGASLGGTLKKIALPVLFTTLTGVGLYFLYNLIG
jgi:uncharacterized protein